MRAWLLLTFMALPLQASAVDGLKVEFSTTNRPNSYSVTVQGVVAARPAVVRHVVLRPCEFKKHYVYVDDCVIWKVEGPTAWAYTLLDLPVLDPRDYVALRTVEQDLNPDGTGWFRLKFVENHTVGPKPRKGVVRVEVNEGAYELAPVGDGKKTLVTYRLTVSPGGAVPVWMGKLAARRAGPETLERIEKICADVEKQNAVQMPVAGNPWAGVKQEPLTLPTIEAPAPK